VHQQEWRKDLLIALGLLGLAVLFFWPVTLGGKTLLPADNVFAWEPWKSYAQQAGVKVPHNSLLSDLYLENYAWKRLIVQALRTRELPLWNPYIFAGVPFLAAGQHSALYPLSILFYVLPIPLAYGWFATAHLFLAGLFTYILGRSLGLKRAGATLAGVSFMFGGFMVIRNVFPMIVAAAVWLPLILALIERSVCRSSQVPLWKLLPEIILGAGAFGMVFLAGHPEMYYYVALSSAAFALWHLTGLAWRKRSWRPLSKVALVLLAMPLLGLGLGTAQWLPLLDLVRSNFRQGSASLQQILGWAYPLRRIISLFIPDFFGNPAHHTYFDLFRWQVVPATVNALGEKIDTIYWGIKNYVEGASYVGTVPFLLAIAGLLHFKGRRVGFFGLAALVSLLFVFGSPLYAVIYYLPGLNQVHSPFRWIYLYSLSMAILAGMGLEALWPTEKEPSPRGGLWARLRSTLLKQALPWGSLLAGGSLLIALGGSLAFKERIAALAERLLPHLALAPQAFSDGRMFYSYEFRNLLIFGLALFGGGAILCLRKKFHRPHVWALVLTLLAVGELFVIGKPFFPAVDPSLVGYRTPAIDFLLQDRSLYRITSYVGGSEKTFNANAGMFYDIADVRGYDSIIPKQYVEYMKLIQEQTELPYNRIAPIFESHPEALDSPLLDLLNVKYVLTSRAHSIERPNYALVYDGEIRIYRNQDALPRAFLVSQALTIPDAQERKRALRTLDPRRQVILEVPVPQPEQATEELGQRAKVVHYRLNEVEVEVDAPQRCFLVLTDSYAKGWLAFIRPVGTTRDAEQRLEIYRANGNFRAVQVPAGRYIVRFKYSPNVVKFGFYVSFLSGIVLLLLGGLWSWMRFYRQPLEEQTLHRVTKNTLAPIALSLVNKAIDMVFAMLMLRILGPVDAGKYYLAVVVTSWFDIFVNFGLNTLVTRDVAREKAQANRYLANSILLRIRLWAVSIPILVLFFIVRFFTKPLDGPTILAICLFGLGLLPSNISASFAALFNAYEKMEIPASVTTLTTLLKVSLGTMVLFLGGGYVGLAAVSIIVNLVTLAILYLLVRKLLFHPHMEIDWAFQRKMFFDSYPLMINLLLATLFFKVAVLLLEWLIPDPRVLGWYSTAYKYVDAVGLVPAYFTMAIFPLMSRYAATDKDSLYRAYCLAIKVLLIIAIPGAFWGWALSKELITILGGSQYLPQAASILRVMIWYMPLGFINSVTQYVLIALDQQRFLTRAFLVGLSFNVIANLIGISQFGYVASAYITVASELALLIPFYVGIRRHLSRIPWAELSWRQILSALPLALLLFSGLPRKFLLLTLPLGTILYLAGLFVLHVFDQEELQAIKQALPLQRLQGAIGRLRALLTR